jgi:hypothetical protein
MESLTKKNMNDDKPVHKAIVELRQALSDMDIKREQLIEQLKWILTGYPDSEPTESTGITMDNLSLILVGFAKRIQNNNDVINTIIDSLEI